MLMLIIENYSLELLSVFSLVIVQESKAINCGILKHERLL
jgi:hypothetical protein